MTATYWLNLFSYKTWNEFLKAGGQVTGFREGRRKTIQKIKPGDRMLCYLTGVSRWIGVLEVTGPGFTDEKPIWEDAVFPERLPVMPVILLEPETAVPITEMKSELSIFSDLSNPHAWTGRVRGSPAKWKTSDGEAVLAALRGAKINPTNRPLDPAKLARRSPVLKDASGETVTVPDEPEEANETAEAGTPVQEASVHTEFNGCWQSWATTWAWTFGSPATIETGIAMARSSPT